jgi:hypothetical protein
VITRWRKGSFRLSRYATIDRPTSHIDNVSGNNVSDAILALLAHIANHSHTLHEVLRRDLCGRNHTTRYEEGYLRDAIGVPVSTIGHCIQ